MARTLLQMTYAVSLIVFMVGNLLGMGLQVRVSDAWQSVRSARFVIATLLGGFIVGPVLAYLVVLVVPMERPYATGMMLLSMAPTAPFLPIVVRKAQADVPAAAGLMLLASIGTILIMPVGIPLVEPGLSATPWSIAKPLLTLIMLPLAVGVVLKSMWDATARTLYLYVKRITGVGTIVFLALVIILNFKGFVGSVGSHALLAQLLYVPVLSLAGYMLGSGLTQGKRAVLSLGMCTRNIGAAAAIVGTSGDQRTMVMLVIATLVTIAVSFAAASWFGRVARRGLHENVAMHV